MHGSRREPGELHPHAAGGSRHRPVQTASVLTMTGPSLHVSRTTSSAIRWPPALSPERDLRSVRLSANELFDHGLHREPDLGAQR